MKIKMLAAIDVPCADDEEMHEYLSTVFSQFGLVVRSGFLSEEFKLQILDVLPREV
jgi:hypothetical protein